VANRPHVETLLDYDGFTFEERERKSGKKHVTITISSTPIDIVTDPIAVGRPVAEAIAAAITAGIKAIDVVASTGTLLRRKYAADAFAAGKSWATRRYSGGRTGAKAPNQSDKLFNDSGRFAEGIVANVNGVEQGWTINATVNRLDPSTFSGDAFTRMLARLRELVPALQNPLAERSVIEAARATWEKMHHVRAEAAAGKRSESLRAGALELLSDLKGLLT
jgi:hypothetical protein